MVRAASVQAHQDTFIIVQVFENTLGAARYTGH
jgi:hypothetical protein